MSYKSQWPVAPRYSSAPPSAASPSPPSEARLSPNRASAPPPTMEATRSVSLTLMGARRCNSSWMAGVWNWLMVLGQLAVDMVDFLSLYCRESFGRPVRRLVHRGQGAAATVPRHEPGWGTI